MTELSRRAAAPATLSTSMLALMPLPCVPGSSSMKKHRSRVSALRTRRSSSPVGAAWVTKQASTSSIKLQALLPQSAVGATRAATDSGFCEQDLMIGITGRVVSPDVYIAIALSGASQHMAGCSGSKNIVAINRDPEANIFSESRFGVVGDYKQVLPVLIEEVQKLMQA